MELPSRTVGDELLKPGELADIRRRLQRISSGHDITTVIACAFDHRTRMLPFIISDMLMVPAGPRAIGANMYEAGFYKTRIVLQQWNRNFSPSRMRLDGRIPDIFMVSSMSLHTASCQDMLRDVCKIAPDHRPLVITGGPLCIYHPWKLFSTDPSDPWGADVVITGEEYVSLQLLEVLLSLRSGTEPLRTTFLRAKNSGMLDEIPGLVYPLGAEGQVPEELVDTGIQRLCGDLDEQVYPVYGYQLLEPPSRKATLASQPVPVNRIHRLSPISSIVMTLGCKFRCHYCPIPAYNQRKYRTKSGERIADEIRRLHKEYGLRIFFGTDDNFFDDKKRALDIVETLARAEINGRPLRKRARIATEVTVHDTIRMKDHLGPVRKAGIRALWLGVEDMTGALVKKGQTVDKTIEAFQMLRSRGILPNPMMMHHDNQPLLTPGRPLGLLNQAQMLQKAGATTLQVLMITPSPGSKVFEETFTSGMVFESVGGKYVEPYMVDGNYVIASKAPEPWQKQFNILLAYLFFYNPFRLASKLYHWRKRPPQLLADVGAQVWGMWGMMYNIRRTFIWALRLMFGTIKRKTRPPASIIPIRGVNGAQAPHAPAQTSQKKAADKKDRVLLHSQG